MPKIINIIKEHKSPKIAILGDFMLDYFIYGEVKRINPEATAPLLSYQKDFIQLGGAGFVSSILKYIDGDITAIGVVGNDNNGEKVRHLLKEKSIKQFIVTDKTRTTTCKQRIEAKNNHGHSISQQLLRIDFEDTKDISAKIEEKIKSFFKENCFDVIIISDYNKGVITKALLNYLVKEKSSDSLLIVDPKKNLSFYRGCDYIKPNRFEMSSIVGFELDSIKNIQKAAKLIKEQKICNNLIISLDKDGLFYDDIQGKQGNIPTKTQEIYDVSGAGDTIIAILAYYASSSLEITDLLKLANTAAQIIICQKSHKFISKELLVKEFTNNYL